MIPPCDPTILESNPQFKKLYQQLTTTLLNADGSTRATDAQPARQAVQEVRLSRTFCQEVKCARDFLVTRN